MKTSEKPAQIFGRMKGKIKVVDDITLPDPELWDSELGIAYRSENGEPVYYTGNGIETTDDLNKQ